MIKLIITGIIRTSMKYIIKGRPSFEDTPFDYVTTITQDYHIVSGPAERIDLLMGYPFVEYAEIEESTGYSGSSALR